MYIEQLALTDFRGFESLQWELEPGECAGWHVLLGPNGSGKSGCLKAAAIGLTGATEFMSARRPTRDFIRRATGVERALIAMKLGADPAWDDGAKSSTKLTLELLAGGTVLSRTPAADDTVWSNAPGWFSAAFGPMRRFAGGSPDNQRLFLDYPRLARHLSIFGEDVALTEALGWLRQLRFQQLEGQGKKGKGSDTLEQVRSFVNQPGFLPHGTSLGAVSSEAVEFKDGNGVTLSVLELSDGYRAVLSMVFELLRLLFQRHPGRDIFSPDGSTVQAPGVVLIDEIDAHLHPIWQREIGPWLTRLFPRLQFIVTTHSPYVVQAATKGSVWTLPAPGGEGSIHRLRGEQLERATLGDVLHVLNSEAFGGLPGRSEEANAQFDELARLNRLHAKGRISAEQDGLRLQLASKLGPLQSGSEA